MEVILEFTHFVSFQTASLGTQGLPKRDWEAEGKAEPGEPGSLSLIRAILLSACFTD